MTFRAAKIASAVAEKKVSEIEDSKEGSEHWKVWNALDLQDEEDKHKAPDLQCSEHSIAKYKYRHA